MKRFKNNAVFKVILRIQPFTSNVLTTNSIASQCGDLVDVVCLVLPPHLANLRLLFWQKEKGSHKKKTHSF